MKLRALANGNEIDVDEVAAKHLIDAGIYVPLEEPKADKADGQTLKRHKPR